MTRQHTHKHGCLSATYDYSHAACQTRSKHPPTKLDFMPSPTNIKAKNGLFPISQSQLLDRCVGALLTSQTQDLVC